MSLNVHRSLILCFAFTVLGAQAHSKQPNQIFYENKGSVVFIRSTITEPSGKETDETGTGFIVSETGYVITANHLLTTNPESARVEARIGSRYAQAVPVKSIPVPSCCDIALLVLPSSLGPFRPVSLSDPDDVQEGDAVVTIGFAKDTDISPTPGTLGTKSGNREGLWRVTNPLNWGDSGSPVFDPDGFVFGMVKGGDSAAQGLNFIIPIRHAVGLIQVAGVSWPPVKRKALKSPSPANVKTATSEQVVPETGVSIPGERLSCNQGPRCASLVVSIPSNATIISIHRYFREHGTGDWIVDSICSRAIGWCEWTDSSPSVGYSANSRIISTTLKNWADNRQRDAKLVVEFQDFGEQ